ncbi:hypothetical protein [Variovorax saccharolyticus]|uniref:hypothetical protein n=1 Tax=Variovorax saccharolyticus TaxID=3053516 RepID=UPI002577F7CD|nr:hypothetical protein [Variovorax sp. J31P216]MDM0029669.1 hypothetical protein [Variovorax sp. J31P216]
MKLDADAPRLALALRGMTLEPKPQGTIRSSSSTGLGRKSSAPSQRCGTGRHVALPGQENDRQVPVAGGSHVQKLDAGGAGHVDIEQQATASPLEQAFEKRFRPAAPCG